MTQANTVDALYTLLSPSSCAEEIAGIRSAIELSADLNVDEIIQAAIDGISIDHRVEPVSREDQGVDFDATFELNEKSKKAAMLEISSALEKSLTAGDSMWLASASAFLTESDTKLKMIDEGVFSSLRTELNGLSRDWLNTAGLFGNTIEFLDDLVKHRSPGFFKWFLEDARLSDIPQQAHGAVAAKLSSLLDNSTSENQVLLLDWLSQQPSANDKSMLERVDIQSIWLHQKISGNEDWCDRADERGFCLVPEKLNWQAVIIGPKWWNQSLPSVRKEVLDEFLVKNAKVIIDLMPAAWVEDLLNPQGPRPDRTVFRSPSGLSSLMASSSPEALSQVRAIIEETALARNTASSPRASRPALRM